MNAARHCERCGRGFSKSNGCDTGSCSEVHRGALYRLFPYWDYPNLRDRDGANRGLVFKKDGVRRCVATHGEIDNEQDRPEAPGTGA